MKNLIYKAGRALAALALIAAMTAPAMTAAAAEPKTAEQTYDEIADTLKANSFDYKKAVEVYEQAVKDEAKAVTEYDRLMAGRPSSSNMIEISRQRDSARAEKRRQEYRRMTAEADLLKMAHSARMAYINLLAAEETIGLQDAYKQAADVSRAVLDTKFKLGMISTDSYLKQKLDLETAQIARETQVKNFELIKIKLSLALGYEAETVIKTGPLPEPEELIEGIDFEKDKTVAKKNSLPLFNAEANMANLRESRDTSFLMLSFLSVREQTVINDQVAAAEARYKEAASAFELDFETYKNAVLTRQISYETAITREKLAESSWQAAQRNYERGALSRLDYLNATAARRQAASNVYQARLDLIAAAENYGMFVSGMKV